MQLLINRPNHFLPQSTIRVLSREDNDHETYINDVITKTIYVYSRSKQLKKMKDPEQSQNYYYRIIKNIYLKNYQNIIPKVCDR